MRILITGSRNWTDREAIRVAIVGVGRESSVLPQDVVVVHGGARGADLLAADVAQALGCQFEVHHADWERYGKRAGIVRNSEMVNLGADVCLAFPLGESRGTRHCMREAEKAGIPVVVHEAVTA
jgi:SLOG family YspA-like protein